MEENSRFNALEQCLKKQTMSTYQRTFVSQVDSTVLDLMAVNQASAVNVAARLCVSISKLRRQLQNATGITPAVYIMLLRMREAVRLLNDYPQDSISSVAQACGFTDHAHFTHTFIRYFGRSPMQYVQERQAALHL
ncbi:MAG: AraC family transcriptional regulator [Bacteroidaceae bacterium]|nr:AraC family transcriptional regulator [Bacteroidaceae bacterium]